MEVGNKQSDNRFDAYIVGNRANRVLVVDRARCKGCKICVSICPSEALFMSSELDRPEKSSRGFFFPIENTKCTSCKQCVYACPDFALSIHKLEEVSDNSQTDRKQVEVVP